MIRAFWKGTWDAMPSIHACVPALWAHAQACPGGRVEQQPTKLWAGGTWRYIARERCPVIRIVAYRQSSCGPVMAGRWVVDSMLRRSRLGPWAPPDPRQAPYYCLLRCRTDLTQGQTRAFFLFVIHRPFLFRAPCRPVPSFRSLLPHLISTSSEYSILTFFGFWPPFRIRTRSGLLSLFDPRASLLATRVLLSEPSVESACHLSRGTQSPSYSALLWPTSTSSSTPCYRMAGCSAYCYLEVIICM